MMGVYLCRTYMWCTVDYDMYHDEYNNEGRAYFGIIYGPHLAVYGEESSCGFSVLTHL